MEPITWAALASLTREPVRVAVSTEHQGTDTLTVQFAVRIREDVVVQVYHASGVPAPMAGWFNGPFRRRFAPWVRRLVVRPPRKLTAELSPARVLAHLLELPVATYGVPSGRGRPPASPDAMVTEAPRAATSRPAIDVQLVGHALHPHFFRAFGQTFWAQLLLPAPGVEPVVAVRDRRVIGLAGFGAERYSCPVVESVRANGDEVSVRLGTFDTQAAFGGGGLGALAGALLGAGTCGDLPAADQGRIADVFRDRPEEAYPHAAAAAVQTLLVAERIREVHRDLYLGLGFDDPAIPRCHGTVGRRVSEVMTRDVARGAAAGSAALATRAAQARQTSLKKVEELFESGAGAAVGRPPASRYGDQLGRIHGGLLLNRSPTHLFDHGPGQFRDVDLGSCYPSVLRTMSVYVGRPVVWEPGRGAVTLKQAVRLLSRAAAGWDGWFVAVTGATSAVPNALVPSTVDALTHLNYRRRAAKARARQAPPRGGRTALYTDEVSFGVVVWATWQMIRALPAKARAEYERLRVESVVFYPKEFVADDGPAFDALRDRLATGADVDWAQRVDLRARTRVTVEDLDESYAALRYPVGRLADRLVEMRREAGKGSGLDRALKVQANTLYGALCSPHLPTQNVVAAQVVTGTARALAFALALSLNAYNVITDGGIYRRDQVPAGTFAACRRARPDYPIRRAEGGVRFLAAADVPDGDEAFTAWYPGHAMRFFGAAGPEYEFLFGMHRLEHKPLPGAGGAAFDGLYLDGGANYAKVVAHPDGGWAVADVKARSFGAAAKAVLGPWLVGVAAADRYDGPPDPVDGTSVLTTADALAACRRALAGRPEGQARAVLPAGVARTRVMSYKLIKWSQFVFRTERQQRRLTAEMKDAMTRTGCGLELLALRATYAGSVRSVAEAVYALVRAGEERLVRLNLRRLFTDPSAVGPAHGRAVAERRAVASRDFALGLLVPGRTGLVPPTGLYLTREEADRLTLG